MVLIKDNPKRVNNVQLGEPTYYESYINSKLKEEEEQRKKLETEKRARTERASSTSNPYLPQTPQEKIFSTTEALDPNQLRLNTLKSQKEKEYQEYKNKKQEELNNNVFKSNNKMNDKFQEGQIRQEFEKSYKNSELSDISKKLGPKDNLTVKNIGLGLLNAGALVGKGAVKGVESFMDFSSDLSNRANNALMFWESEEQKKKNTQTTKDFIKRDLTEELMNAVGWNDDIGGQTVRDYFNKNENAFINEDNLLGQVAEGVGNQGVRILTSGGNPSLGTAQLLATSYGSGVEEAYKGGANSNQAMLYGLGNAGIELGTEMLTGGMPGFKGNNIGGLDKLTNPLLNNIKNQTGRAIAKTAYNIAGEGLEEALSEIASPYLKNLTYSKGEKVNWNDVWNSALQGGITAGILNSGDYANDFKDANSRNQAIKENNTIIKEINKTLQSDKNLSSEQLTNLQNTINILQEQNIELTKNIETRREDLKKQQNNPAQSKINNTFTQQVDDVIDGKFPKRDMLTLSDTPKVLQDLGLDNLPITMTQKHLETIMNREGRYKKANYHDLGIDLIKQLPEAINNPLDIVESKTDKSSIVLTTELADKNDNPIIASVKIDGKGTINDVRINTNVMTSAYGKSNYDSFMKDNIANGRLLYDIDQGIKKRVTRDRLQLPMRDNSSDNNISQNNISVNNSNMQKQQNNDNIAENIIDEDYIKINNKSLEDKQPTLPKLDDKTAKLLDKRAERVKPSVKDNLHKVSREIINKGEAIDRLSKKAGNRELTHKYDKLGTADAEGQYVINTAQTDNEGKRIGKSINEIWKPVEDANLVTEFSDYLLHKHNIARFAQGKPVFGNDVTSEISLETSQNYEKEHPEFKEWAKDINVFNKNQLQNLVDAGLTNEESQKYYNDTYDNYVRIDRKMTGTNPIAQDSKGLKIKEVIKKAKGGNQDILPLKDSMAEQAIKAKRSIRENQLGQELGNILSKEETTFDSEAKNNEGEYIEKVSKNENGNYYLTYFEEGKPVRVEIDEGIYEALKPSKNNNPKILAPVRKMASWQRELLTNKNPLFIVTNFFKDIGDAPFNSKYGSKFMKNYAKASKEISSNSELWNQYKALGGEQNTYFDYDTGVQKESNSKIKKFLSKIESANQIVEQLPRFTEFLSTIEAGGSLTEAMYNSAEVTTNFKRGGDLTKALNRNGFNFLNASIQGFDKQIRNFTGQNGAKGYVNLLAKATVFGMLPSVLNDLLMGDDKDYEELPEYIKDNYYLFKTGDDKFIRIPKGRVMSVFGSAARRSMNASKGDKEAFKGFLDNVQNQVAPNNPLTDNVFSPITSVGTNVAWNGSQIVPRRLQDVPTSEQYDEKTSEISKLIGKTINKSPKKIDYLLDQYSGAIGDFILPSTTKQAKNGNIITAPIADKFTTDSVINNKNTNNFFDKVQELNVAKNSMRATEKDILRAKYINSKQSQINQLYSEKRKIQNSDLNNTKKYKQVRNIQKEINALSKIALQDYDTIYKNEFYSIVGDMEFYKQIDGTWKKISEDQLKSQNKSNLDPKEYWKRKYTISKRKVDLKERIENAKNR